VLNRQLAGAIDLHARIKQADWNVRGPTFIAIHELHHGRYGSREVTVRCSDDYLGMG